MDIVCQYIEARINYYADNMLKYQTEMKSHVPGSKTLYDNARLRWLSYLDVKDQMVLAKIWELEEN